MAAKDHPVEIPFPAGCPIPDPQMYRYPLSWRRKTEETGQAKKAMFHRKEPRCVAIQVHTSHRIRDLRPGISEQILVDGPQVDSRLSRNFSSISFQN